MNTGKKANNSLNSNVSTSKILKTVPFKNGFHFFKESMEYTGITATSLFEFEEKLKIISARSVEYHFRRHDFQRWIRDSVGDVEIAAQIACLDMQLSTEKLRKKLLTILRKRIREAEKHHSSGG